jgi:hypothetical protein
MQQKKSQLPKPVEKKILGGVTTQDFLWPSQLSFLKSVQPIIHYIDENACMLDVKARAMLSSET